MHFYQFNIGDYRRDTSHLKPIEHYIHRTLIDWYYLDERPIPKETQVVMRRLNLGLEFFENLQNVLKDFYVLRDDGYHQKRIDSDIASYHEKSEQNRINGALGGRPKKTQVVSERKPTEKQNKSESNPNQEPITNNHIKNHCAEMSARFIEFWETWPKSQRKVGKAACLKKWKSQKLDLIADQIIAHVNALKQTKQWRDGFEPAPATYINQKRWHDEVIANDEKGAASPPWFLTASGIEGKAVELKIVMMKDEQWRDFKIRVLQAAGITPDVFKRAKNDWGNK